MKKWPIALQVYSVREDAERDFEGTMRAVKAMGFDGVELAGTYGKTAVECKAILDEIGLELMSAHVAPDLLKDDEVLDDYAAAGIRYVAIPWYAAPKDEAELEKAIAEISSIGERVKARGMQLLYHNHDFEFGKIGDARILDTYYSRISDDCLQTELDMCWVRVGGEDPAEYLRRYAGRSPVVHLKDYVGSKSENMYALIGNDTAKEEKTNTFEFRPVGSGVQDIPAILTAAEAVGAKWLVVEQDAPCQDKTPLECAESSIGYLREIMK